ncbi:hypothetical protein KKG46_04300 [Patescibacteria group bacterium]|nr:hypothetical protein [Patescibacteria group bacterium]
MRWFYLNTHDRNEFEFGWIGEDIKIFKKQGRVGSLVAEISGKINLSSLKKCSGICAVGGPGSFSSIRGGVLVANLISRILRKPLYGISVSDAKDLKLVSNQLTQNKIKSVKYLNPIYDQEPNITIQTKKI